MLHIIYRSGSTSKTWKILHITTYLVPRFQTVDMYLYQRKDDNLKLAHDIYTNVPAISWNLGQSVTTNATPTSLCPFPYNCLRGL